MSVTFIGRHSLSARVCRSTKNGMKALIATLFLCSIAVSASAQGAAPTFVVDLFGLTASYQAPPWTDSEIAIDQTEVSR